MGDEDSKCIAAIAKGGLSIVLYVISSMTSLQHMLLLPLVIFVFRRLGICERHKVHTSQGKGQRSPPTNRKRAPSRCSSMHRFVLLGEKASHIGGLTGTCAASAAVARNEPTMARMLTWSARDCKYYTDIGICCAVKAETQSDKPLNRCYAPVCTREPILTDFHAQAMERCLSCPVFAVPRALLSFLFVSAPWSSCNAHCGVQHLEW